MTKHRHATIIILVLTVSISALNSTLAQTRWTVEQCMSYAVEHNHDVRLAALNTKQSTINTKQALGNFMPNVEANVGVQYNFGRAIDPETNTYTDVSTFYNGYSVTTSIPVFDGFARIHALRAARTDVLKGKSAERQQRDQTALAVYQAFIDVLYYQGTVRFSAEKAAEQESLLRLTRTMEEIGQKSLADVAQIEAQKTEADYNVTCQQNLLESALLTLKQTMNYPLGDELLLADMPQSADAVDSQEESESYLIYNIGTTNGDAGQHFDDDNPALRQAYYAQQSALHQLREARAAFFPTVSVGAGISTTYYKSLHTPTASSFSQQFHNNMGEYIYASVSIPLFNRLQTISSVRRAKVNYQMARETYEKQRDELQKITTEAALDVENCRRETRQMLSKVRADSLAYALVKRKYKEGLLSATELKASSATLLQSEATLLQKQLTLRLKRLMLNYYLNGTLIVPYSSP